MRPLTEQEHALLEAFHATPLDSLCPEESWEALTERFRVAYAGLQDGFADVVRRAPPDKRRAARLRLIREAAKRVPR